MDCPVCGCCTAEPEGSVLLLAECDCCGTVWVVSAESMKLERVLVGPEG